MGVRELRLVVVAEDYDAAVGFYRDVLGLPARAAVSGPAGAEVTILEAGRATLELANPAQRAYIDEVEVGRAVSPRLRVAFEVDDARSVTAELVAAGAQEIAPPRPTPFGSVNARLDAPAGLQITVFQPTGGGPVDARLDVPGGDSVGARPDPAGGDVEIRDAVAEDWSAIWPFFREIVAAGETYAWPRDMAEDAARAAWFPAPGRTVVAVGAAAGGRQRQAAAEPAGPRRARRQRELHGRPGARRSRHRPRPGRARAGPAPRPTGTGRCSSTPSSRPTPAAVALWRSLGFDVVGDGSRRLRPPRAGPVDLLMMHRRL